MIIETLVTTIAADGSVNIAPLGAVLDAEIDAPSATSPGDVTTHFAANSEFTLRPFDSSRTWRNLRENGEGVLHLSDNAEWFVRGALDRWDRQLPQLVPASEVRPPVLQAACRRAEFRVLSFDDSQSRAEVRCRVLCTVEQSPFAGLNRAAFATIEMAILASRFHLVPPADVADQWERCRVIIGKTAGPRELAALRVVEEFQRDWLADRAAEVGNSTDASNGESQTSLAARRESTP